MTSYCTLEEAWGTSDLSSNDYPPPNVGNYNVNRLQEDMENIGVGAPIQDVDYSKLIGMNTKKHAKQRRKRTKPRRHENKHIEVETASDVNVPERKPDRVPPRYMQSPNGLNYQSLNENVGIGGIDGLRDDENIHSLQYVPRPSNIPEPLSTPLNQIGMIGEEIEEEELIEKYDDTKAQNKQTKSNDTKLDESLKEILTRLDRMEKTLIDLRHNNTNKNKGNIHDIVLFVLMGIFLIFILDSIFRVGRMTPVKALNTSNTLSTSNTVSKKGRKGRKKTN